MTKQAQDDSDTPNIQTDNAVTAIILMSDLLAASLSSLKTTVTNSFTEMQNLFEQFSVEEVTELSDIEKNDNGATSSKHPRVEGVDLSHQYGPIEHNNALTAAPQNDIANLINQSCQSSSTEALHPVQVIMTCTFYQALQMT
jgi:hypothetical protein